MKKVISFFAAGLFALSLIAAERSTNLVAPSAAMADPDCDAAGAAAFNAEFESSGSYNEARKAGDQAQVDCIIENDREVTEETNP